MTRISQKKWLLITGPVLVFVILGLLFAYRNDIYQSLQDPGVPFQTYVKPPAPDYSLPEAWMSLPDLDADPYKNPLVGDVFVVAPQVYNGGEHWNLPVEDQKRRMKLDQVIKPNYVDPYNTIGRLFAPYYRQATTYTFMTLREDARRAQDFAYWDVRRAFLSFLENSPPERPIVLIGHNQGGSHLIRLLEDFFEGDLAKRLAGAYVIGHPLPLDKFDSDISTLSPCETETDTSCIIAFGAFTVKEHKIAKRFKTRMTVFDGRDYTLVNERPLLCMNPLIWSRSTEYAPRRFHRGAVAAKGVDSDTRPAPQSKQFGAACEDGVLVIDRPKATSLRRPKRLASQYKTSPYNLFSEDIKTNALDRINMLYANGDLPRRAKAIEEIEIIEIVESPVTPFKPD